MNGLLLDGDRLQAVEHGVDVACVRAQIEDGLEVEPRRDLVFVAYELAEVELFVPGAHRVALHELVRIVA
jgi:hypothetical protein